MIGNVVLLLGGLICGAWLLNKILPLEEDLVPFTKNDRKSLPSISVIIPARNEERNLTQLLPSIKGQQLAPFEVIVVDDGSTDRTAAIAESFGAIVVNPGELPDGWLGKSWACWNGAQAASGHLLIFLDADTCLEDAGLAVLAEAHSNQKGLLSIQPYHKMKRPYEWLSAFFNIIVLAAVGAPQTAAATKKKAVGAFGPCIVCTRESYFQTGGHEAVRERILENYSLGLLFAEQQTVRNCSGKGVIAFRMYPEGIRQLCAGWSKSFASGASSTTPLRLLAIIWWLTGSITVVTQWTNPQIWRSSDQITIGIISYLAYVLLINIQLSRAGNFGFKTAFLFPIPLLFFMGIFASSTLQTFFRRKVTWKGRSISTMKGSGRK